MVAIKNTINRLNKNENNFLHHPAIRQLLRKLATNQNLSYYTQEYNQDLYKSISSLHSVIPGNLYIDNGLETAFMSIFKSIKISNLVQCVYLSNIHWPHYQQLLQNSFYTKGQLKKYESLVDLEMSLFSCPSSLVIITNPNNPSGNNFSDIEIINLIKKFPRHLFIIDEAYAGFGNQNYRESSTIRYAVSSSNLIVARTFSKFFSIPGLRIGYLITNSSLMEKLKLTPLYLGLNCLAQPIAIELLKNYPFYQARANKIRKIRDLSIASFNKNSLFTAFQSNANFFLVKINKKINVTKLNQYFADNNYLVKIIKEGPFKNYLRITLAPLSVMSKFQKTLEEYLNNNYN